ncbi:MAG: MMPL family transporter [Myxococcales bacterium]|nr:MMPL family transporter [Myxococcales bacterium]
MSEDNDAWFAAPLLGALLRRRAAVIVAVVAMSLAGAALVPRLEARFSPDDLLPSDVTGEGPLAESSAWAPEMDLVVTVRASDVLASDALTYVAHVTDAVRSVPGILAVDGLLATPFPRVEAEAPADLEDLEDDATTLDMPMDEATNGPLAALAQAAPDRFPMGLASVGEAIGGVAVTAAPLSEGGRVDEEAVRRVAGGFRSLEGRLLARDRRATLVVAHVSRTLAPDELGALVREVRERVRSVRAPAGASASVGGLPAVEARLMSLLASDAVRLAGLATVASLLVLAWTFRRLASVMIPFSVVGVTLAWVFGAMAAFGEPLNLVNNVIPPLLVSIGLSDAIHLVGHHRAHVAAGMDPRAASMRVAAELWRPCLLTSVTTAVGFASLAFTDVPVVARFGVLAAAATMLAYAVTMLWVPVVLAVRGAAGDAVPTVDSVERAVRRFAVRMEPWRGRVAWSFAAGAIALVFVTRGLATDSALLDNVDATDPELVAVGEIESVVGGVRSVEVTVQAPGRTWLSADGVESLDALGTELGRRTGARAVERPTDALHDAWSWIVGGRTEVDAAHGADAWSEPLRTDAQVTALASLVGDAPLRRAFAEQGTLAHFVLRFSDAPASDFRTKMDAASDVLREHGVRYRIGGEAFRAAEGLPHVVRALVGSLGLGSALIFVTLLMGFRSLRLALLAAPATAFPLLVTAAYMTCRGIPLHAGTTMVFVVTVGLVVDGAIHVVSEFARVAPGLDRVAVALGASGRGVLIGSATLLAGFAPLATSSFVPIRLFGELSIVAVLASVGSVFVLLPALLALFGTARPAESRSRYPARAP